MRTRSLLVAALVVVLAVSGCLVGDGDAGNATADRENASTAEDEADATEGRPAANDSATKTLPGNGSPVVVRKGLYERCPAGTNRTIEEAPEPADVQGALRAGGLSVTGGEIGGTVTVRGRMRRAERDVCHVSVEFDEPLRTEAFRIARFAVWTAENYSEVVFHDTSNTRRLRHVRNATGSRTVVYDAAGVEIRSSSGDASAKD